MDDFFRQASSRPGLRLHKLEVFNWGTFDSSDGRVFTVRPEGRTSLLVGQNGAGKSTLADALLTLLVRSGTRSYNVAAGAVKRGHHRTERTYIRGAYDHGGAGAGGGGTKLQFLREGSGLHAVILGVFRNEDRPEADFTLAQVLYLNSDDRSEKVFAFAEGEKSIAADLSGFSTFERLRRQIEQRGFRATTTFSQYEKWYFKAAGLRPKAMDVFNQTVAVKDIASLNQFIRRHMLEKRNWRDEIDRILKHFKQLSEAHRLLVQARRQVELLAPVVRAAKRFRKATGELEGFERLKAAAPAWFRRQLVATLEPLISETGEKREAAEIHQREMERRIAGQEESIRHLRNEIDQAGGPRLQQLPGLIRQAGERADRKRASSDLFARFVREAGLDVAEPLRESEAFAPMREALGKRRAELDGLLSRQESKKITLGYRQHKVDEELAELHREIEALKQRKTALPESFAEMRRQLCAALHLGEKDLPFAAELIAVKPSEREWESSIEMVLRSFALSLLVPDRHYRQVSEFVNRTRLADRRGRGQRLVYLHIGGVKFDAFGGSDPRAGAAADPAFLPGKLDYRAGQALEPWVRGEIARRFAYACCRSVEEFQAAAGDAMTSERHVKSRGLRHEKDDRRRVADPANFVLGWDNREKLRHLAGMALGKQEQRDELAREIALLDSALKKMRGQSAAVGRALETTAFDDIDYLSAEREVANLRAEEEALRSGSEKLRTLHERLDATRAERRKCSGKRDDAIKRIDRYDRDLQTGRRLLAEASGELARWTEAGVLASYEAEFGALRARLDSGVPPLPLDDPFVLGKIESEFLRGLDRDLAAAREKVAPLQGALVERMAKFLRKFEAFENELRPAPEYADSFVALHDQLVRDDLPGLESRFKERLNDKATKEIAILNGELQNEVREIQGNIRLLNDALRGLPYRRGTHMQLRPEMGRDPEITKFQRQLRECLSDAFEGSIEAQEDRFRRIEKLIVELRDGERYRDKVTDVRQWFDFYASEIHDETGEERSRYSDSSGRSGGEKAKLAFTILAAAIAYQYGIDPRDSVSDRFHFVMVDEMFSKVDDDHALYALELFKMLNLQLLIVAPLDAKARVTEDHVNYYLLVTKDDATSHSQVFTMTADEFKTMARGPGATAT